jgi:autotransporter-associated beta strand protein
MLTLAGGLLNTSSSASIGDAINVSGSTQLQSSTTGNLVLNGNITGGGNLEVIPTGVLNQVQLGGSNSGYSGTLTVDSGNTAIAFNSASAGSANAAFVLNDNASQRAALAFGTGTINFGSLAGSGYLANTAAGTTTVSVGALNTSGTFSGVLEGNGADAIALTVVGTGALTLAGSNGYSGATTINSGATLQLGTGASGNDGTIGNSSGITDNGTLIYNRYGNLSSNVAISGGGNVTISGSGSQTLTAVNTYNGATTINSGATLQLGNGTGGNDGIIGNTSGVTDNGNLIFNRAGANTASYQIAGTGNVTVSGAGSQTLANGNDNYSGTTTVNGTLIVAGGLTGNGPVTVNSGGTLGAGTGAAGSGGTIDGPVNVAQGGTLAPGALQPFAGTVMTIDNNLTLSGTANMALNLDLNNNADLLVVSGNLALDPSTTDTLTLNLLGTMTAPETLTYLIAFYGSESGSFGNIVVNGPAIFDSINYNDANFGGNAISVTLTVVPEPATWASILGGLGMLVAFQRMRRHNSKSQGSL